MRKTSNANAYDDMMHEVKRQGAKQLDVFHTWVVTSYPPAEASRRWPGHRRRRGTHGPAFWPEEKKKTKMNLQKTPGFPGNYRSSWNRPLPIDLDLNLMVKLAEMP